MSATSNATGGADIHPESRADLLRQIAEATPPRWWEIWNKYIHQPGEYLMQGTPIVKIVILSFVLSIITGFAWYGLFQAGPDLELVAEAWLLIVFLCMILTGINDGGGFYTVIGHIVRGLVPGSRFVCFLAGLIIRPLERRRQWRNRWHLEELRRRLRELEPPSASGSTSGV